MHENEPCHLIDEEPMKVFKALKDKAWKAAIDKEINQIMRKET